MINKTTALVVGALMFTTSTFALDDYSQHNFKVTKDNLSVTYRDHDNLDKSMAQIDYKFAGFGYGYRYQESKGDVEHRLRLNTPSLIKWGNLKVTPRFEYRAFDKETKDDFGNVWLRFEYKHNITDNMSAYVKVQPKFAIDKEGFDDGEYYESQNNIGVDYKLSDTVTVGMFGEKNYDQDWDTQSIFLGTNISYKF